MPFLVSDVVRIVLLLFFPSSDALGGPSDEIGCGRLASASNVHGRIVGGIAIVACSPICGKLSRHAADRSHAPAAAGHAGQHMGRNCHDRARPLRRACRRDRRPGHVVSVTHAQQITLRVQQFLPAAAPVPTNFLAPVGEEDRGGIGRPHQDRDSIHSMQLGGTPPQVYDQVKDGVIDLAWTLPGYTPNRFPKSEVFELPFIAGNGEQNSAASLGVLREAPSGRVQGRQDARRPDQRARA